MQHNFFLSNSTQIPFNNTNFSPFQPSISINQDSNHSTILTSDKQKDLNDLKSLQQNNHKVLCNRAHLQAKRKNHKIAYEMCIKAIEETSKCYQCVTLYLQLYDIILPRRLPLLDILLKRFQKDKTQGLDIYLELKKIKKSQNLDQDYIDLFTDLELNGAEFSQIMILSQNDDNRTIVARTAIEKDETILFVPKRKMILLQDAKASLIVKKVKRQRLYLRSPKHTQLTIFMLEQAEKGQQSTFWFYIKHLPTNFDTFPINYKPHELKYLKGSPFLDQIQTKISEMKSDYESICNICPQFQRFSFDDFKKFRLIVGSRLFGINIGKVKTDALVPLADMLNHNIPKQTSWYYSVPHEGFIIKSAAKIEKGEQIYDSYGLKCNSRFLLNYGFVMSENEVNQAIFTIPFEYQEDDRKQTYRQVTMKVTTNIKSRQFDQLLSIMRHSIIQMWEDNRELISIDKIKETQFVNFDVELQIWQKLQQLVETQLQEYPTTLKQDNKLLMSKDLSTNYFNCLILRKGQKQIYHFYLTMAKKMIRFFKSNMGSKALDQVQEYQSYIKKLNFS